MDFIMDYEKAKGIVKEEGWDGFLGHFQEEHKELDLYSCSTYWENDPQYICKFRGSYGDVVMGWKGVHDKNYSAYCGMCGKETIHGGFRCRECGN